MTGFPTLLVELEDAAGAFTHDITAFVNMKAGWTIRRGRNDEETEVEPGRLAMRLDNLDGRFTLGSTSYDGIFDDKRIRLSETVGGVTTRRYVGYVQEWPATWASPLGNVAVVSVTAVDRFSRLNRRKLRSTMVQEVAVDGPLAIYALGEAAGSTSVGDTSGKGQSALDVVAGTPAVVLGSPGLQFGDEATGALFGGGGAGGYIAGGLVTTSLPAALDMAAVFRTTMAGQVGVLAGFNVQLQLFLPGVTCTGLAMDPAGHVLFGIGTTMLTTATAYNDGLPHMAALEWDGTNLLGYVDGVLVGSVAATGAELGALSIGYLFAGTLQDIVVGTAALPAGRVLSRANALLNGFNTDTADQRIARLAGYANIPPAELDLETGLQPSIAAASTDGVYTLPAMSAVVDAEGGSLFIAGDGRLTLHNKSHRVYSATQPPALALTGADVNHDDLTFGGDKDYLVNTATGNRPGGADQRSENAASVAQFDEYETSRSGMLLNSDELVKDRLDWLTGMYGAGLSRLATFTLDLLTLPQATVQAALALEFGDRVTIAALPNQAPNLPDLIIEGSTEEQQQGEGAKWKLTFNTAPASLFHAWVLGDPVYGVLDSTTRLYF